jgi:peroxiredoxin-like protein
VTDKSSDKFGSRPGAYLHPVDTVSINDRCEIASADSLMNALDLEWRADQRFGEVTVGEAHICVSEPRVMVGAGAGMSPEDLFVAATASSYCVTLAEMLRAVGLPQSALSIHAEGLVASDTAAERFTTVIVRPTIQGADTARRDAYAKAAIAARNNCFIGRSIRGNIAYVVGEVCLAGL